VEEASLGPRDHQEGSDDFRISLLRSSGSGTGSTQPREELLERKVGAPKLTAVEIRCADHATPSIR
jgi:hypothetical protein